MTRFKHVASSGSVANSLLRSSSPDVLEEFIRFPAKDGYMLAGCLFSDARLLGKPVQKAIVFNSGAGVNARRYRHFARFVASNGIPVLTYDYRGIGQSRSGSLRGFQATIEDWSEYDCGGALAWLQARTSAASMIGVGHSIGSVFFGPPAFDHGLRHLVMIGPHCGYFGDYHLKYRLLMGFVWHGLMPALTTAFGYFPARALRLGADLPKGIVAQWARKSPDPVPSRTDDTERLRELQAKCRDLSANALMLTFIDDGFGTALGAKRVQDYFPALNVEHWIIDPRDYGAEAIGHFGVFRRTAPPALLAAILARLLLLPASGSTSRFVPPSGTKELVTFVGP